MPYFEGADGTSLFYTDWGQGKPVVFVTGAWLSSSAWEFQMLPLSEKGLRCVAYDKRGTAARTGSVTGTTTTPSPTTSRLCWTTSISAM